MKNINYLKQAITSTVMLGGVLAAMGKEEIRTYSVPKAKPFVSQKQSMTAPGAPSVDVNATPIHWHAPAEWKELAPTSVRIGNFLVTGKNGKTAEVSITSFPGDVGGELSNVNRWRNELGLPPVEEKDLSSEKAQVGSSGEGKLYQFTGEQSSTVVASLSREGAMWFFKLRGDKETVAETKTTFIHFLKDIHFEDHSASISPSDPQAPLGSAPDPHATLTNIADNSNPNEPKFDAPAHWKEKPASAMVVKSFSISHNDNNAAVSISVLPGDVGGTFANVNRWRRQISLPPITNEDLPKLVTNIDVTGGKATLVDMQNTESKSRLVAISVPQGENTWFYKLMGDEAAVAQEKEAFIQFVQKVRYP